MIAQHGHDFSQIAKAAQCGAFCPLEYNDAHRAVGAPVFDIRNNALSIILFTGTYFVLVWPRCLQ